MASRRTRLAPMAGILLALAGCGAVAGCGGAGHGVIAVAGA